MSGFQIPGLGFAKPNEKLPPLPADQAVSAPSAASDTKDIEIQDATQPPTTTQSQTTSHKPEIDQNIQNASSDAMALGQIATTSEQQQAAEAQQTAQGAHPEWEADSSPYESSSESSSSDSSDEDSDNEAYELLSVEETARLLMEAEGGSDDEGDKGKSSGAGHMRTKNEVAEEPVPKPDVTITPEMKIEELGEVEHIVENLMLIKAYTPGEYQVLDTGSVLCNSERVVIGAVAETIGKVLQPMYIVHFNSQDEIKELGLAEGSKIFYAAEHATFVFTEPLKKLKGSDASNLHDEEAGDGEMEFSDDEKEAEYKRSIKQKKKEKWKNNNKDREPHPLRQEVSAGGGLNYDEDDDGPYKPLTRPPGYGNGPISTEVYDPHHRPGSHRGRGRDSRGRGNRGRGSGRGGRGGSHPRDGYSLPPQGGNQNSAPPPPPQWNQGGAAAVPALPNFGFQIPGQGGAAPQNGAFLNPAFIAALMSQMQAQNGQQQWGGQQPPPPQGGQ
ncbi:unnamed protein product [Clonostachys rosea f. rosea IK726]|uniref:H/ACA ribonucleoprotein complex non-core subunit NAF1 n=2 Tax=Bionectria ochroleuca TaxID=29856 RepID=A0A0B7JID2_BIOOC|nr:unnamed protein product [Clonostachys rosea f. rosea IK726]